MSDTIHKAIDYALDAHRGQTRKFTGAPYWHHLARVAGIVSGYAAGYPNGDELVAAAWLHDIVEDTGFTYWEVLNTFGPLVAEVVRVVTKDSSIQGNRAFRNDRYNEQLEKARLAWSYPYIAPSALIKLADIYDNLSDFPLGDSFGGTYAREKLDTLDAIDPKREHELTPLILYQVKRLGGC